MIGKEISSKSTQENDAVIVTRSSERLSNNKDNRTLTDVKETKEESKVYDKGMVIRRGDGEVDRVLEGLRANKDGIYTGEGGYARSDERRVEKRKRVVENNDDPVLSKRRIATREATGVDIEHTTLRLPTPMRNDNRKIPKWLTELQSTTEWYCDRT